MPFAFGPFLFPPILCADANIPCSASNRKRLRGIQIIIKGSLNGWLTALTRNAALNRARARRGDDVPLEDTVPHSGGSAEDALLRREQRAIGFEDIPL